MIRNKFFYIFSFLCCSHFVIGQDLHFSQFYNTTYNINPAYRNLDGFHFGVSSLTRSQWLSIPVPYTSSSLQSSLDLFPFASQKLLDLQLGIIFNYDKAGDLSFRWTEFGINPSLGLQINKNNKLVFGLQALFSSRRYNLSAIKTSSQYREFTYQPDLDVGENIALDQSNNFKIAAGLSLQRASKPDNRNQYSIGFGIYNLNKPKTIFLQIEDNTFIPLRFTSYGNVWWQLSKKWDINGNLLIQFQEIQDLKTSYNEFLFGSGIRYNFVDAKQANLSLAFLLAHRWKDAIIPSLQFCYNNITAYLAYDINTSNLNIATNGRGGIEIGVNYRIKWVEPAPLLKYCPIK